MKRSGRNIRSLLVIALAVSVLTGWTACTLKHKIEPSDKPFVVNLNVKIDHEIKVKIQEKNEDLLNLEEQVLGEKSKG